MILACRGLRSLLLPMVVFVSCGSLFAQDDPDKVDQLRKAFANVPKRFQLKGGADASQPLTLLPEPVLNWSNPIRRTPAGGLFLWTLKGRPQVALCVYPNNDRYDYEFQSLATSPIEATVGYSVAWAPRESGVEYRKLDVGVPPRENTAGRLLQLRGIARGFEAKLTPSGRPEVPLRMLTAPLYRYPSEGLTEDIVDGAVFTFVQGTDPEVVLIVEATQDGSWQFALARMSVVPSQVSYRGDLVWEVKPARTGRESPYHVIRGVERDDAVIETFD